MKKLLTILLIIGCSGGAMAQIRTLELGQREIDISVLPQGSQAQFRADYQMILADDQLKSTYAELVKKEMPDFTGTEEERIRVLARIAHEVVEHTASTDTTGTEQISPESASAGLTARVPIRKQVTVSSDALLRQADVIERIDPSPSAPSGGNKGYPNNTEPSAPVIMPTNVFRGEVAYAIPDTMEMGKVYKVELIVGIDADIARQLASRQAGDTRSDQIGIGRYMKAELEDFYAFGEEEGAFDIELWKGQQIQTIDLDNENSTIRWEWKVRAESEGEQVLGVHVSIILFDERLPNGRGYQNIDTYEKPIVILATAGQRPSQSPSQPSKRPNQPQAGRTDLYIPVVALTCIFLVGIGFFLLSRSRQQRKYKLEQQISAPEIPEVEAGDGRADPEEIKALIKAGEFEAAAGELKDLAIIRAYEDRTSIIALQARIQHWQSDVHNNVIDGESARQERSRITLALLHVLENILEEQT